VNYEGNFGETNDLGRCCLDAAKQLECFRERQIIEDIGQTEWVCQTGEVGPKILLDDSARRYCVKQPYY
jgi:hypothetical protein